MNPMTLLLALVTLAFGAWSGWIMLEIGYLGIWRAGLAGPGAQQILVDLVIVCTLASVWIWADARRSGRNPWPYLLLTLGAGSIGPLAYLLVGRLAAPRRLAQIA